MFVDNINPILFSMGPFSVRYYGLTYVVGFIIGYFFLRYAIKQKKLKLTYDQLDVYFIWLIFGSILMARLFDVFVYNWPEYSSNLNAIYQIWNGGLAFQGGLLGAIIVTYIVCRRYKIDFYDIADLLVIPTAFTLILGKLANYTNSELYGTITNVKSTPWCVVFEKIDSYCRHPEQIYEAIGNMFIFGVLLTLYLYEDKHNKKFQKPRNKGMLFWLFVLLYAVVRFFLTFYRDEPLYYFLSIGLNVGQWTCVLMVIIAGLFLWKIKSKNI